MDRRQRILGPLDLAKARGLEIGPRQAPLIAKADGDVLYVDYAATEELKRSKPDTVEADAIHEVDLVWGEVPLVQAAGGPVDYVVASHVIEHVPDLAGWLKELRDALKPEGVVCLAIPDRRFTFDLHRPETRLGEVVEAHLTGRRRPSVQQVFDSYGRTRPNDHQAAWTRNPKAALPPLPEKLAKGLALARSLIDQPRYIDAHCWIFTPRAFLDLMEGLAGLGWLPFRLAHFQPTLENDMEFVVRLAPCDDAAAIAASLAQARAALAAAAVPPEERDAAPSP